MTILHSNLVQRIVTFSPTSVTVSGGSTDSAEFTMTAAADTTAGVTDITVDFSESTADNSPTSLTVSENKLTVIDGPSTIELSSATTIVKEGVASSIVNFVLDVAPTDGTFTLTSSADGITFNPASVTVSGGSNTSANFTMTAGSDSVVGMTDINVAITTTDGASNLGTTPLTVSGNKLRVTLTTPSFVELSSATTIVEGGDNSSSVHFVLDVAPTDGTFTLTPTGTDITFYPLSVTVEEGSLTSANFTMTAAADTEVGITDINVAISTTDGASNVGTTPLTVSTNKLTVVQAASVVIDTIRLSSTVSVNADSTSSNLHFVLNTAPDGGNVTLRPTGPDWITFDPETVDVIDGNTMSANFTMDVNAGATAGTLPAISVEISGTATNIDRTTLDVVPENVLIIPDNTEEIEAPVNNISRVSLSGAKSMKESSQTSSVKFEIDVAATGGDFIFVPTAINITFDNTVTISEGNTQSGDVSVSVFGIVSDDYTPIIDVAISEDSTATNVDTTSFTVAQSTLRIDVDQQCEVCQQCGGDDGDDDGGDDSAGGDDGGDGKLR